MRNRISTTQRNRVLLVVVPVILLVAALAFAGFILEIVARVFAGAAMVVLILAAGAILAHLMKSWKGKHDTIN